MAELKREYVVPLRRKTRYAPRWRRSKKAVSVLNEFISKHMKTDNVILCKELNEYIWKNGAKNPPGKVSVIALKKEFNGTEKTLVNLVDVGIDKQIELYNMAAAIPQTPEQEAKEETQELEEDIKEEKEAKKEEAKEEKKEASKKDKKEDKKE